MDANLVPSRVLTQTRIDVIFKKEMETRSKIQNSAKLGQNGFAAIAFLKVWLTAHTSAVL
jgi:hypothetical protein